MRIQPIVNQPNYKGKVILGRGVASDINPKYLSSLWHKLDEVTDLVSEKPYDLFISKNKQNPEFCYVAANTSFDKAQNVKEYTVKIQTSILPISIVDAAKDAIEMYEKYIAKGIKG